MGRSFHGTSLLEEQAAALERITAIAADAAVDAVLIAGDLYDRAIPPADAVRLFDHTVRRLRETGAAVVAIAGNHDSHVRVSVYDGLLGSLGITIRGEARRCDEPVLVTPRRGGEPVAIYPLPFLDPSLDGPTPTRLSHEDVTRLALARIHADWARRGGQAVLVAHTFVAGGSPSESERELSVGNVERVSVGAFAGFAYVALGHLHGAQELDGPRLAYSGTPLPYSFSEEGQRKSVRLVDLNDDGSLRVEVVPLGVGRPLRTIAGPLADLLSDPALADAAQARLRVILTDESLPLQAMARLRPRFPHIAELRHRPPERPGEGAVARAERIGPQLSPLERSLAFFADQQGRAAEEPERRLLRDALEAAGKREER
ncbi:MAG: exonuclease SbcCD subunit D [Cyanobium sp.]